MKQHNPLFLAIATEAQSHITEVDVNEAKRKLESHNTIFIDVRETYEWQAGHLPNAIHLSKGVLERDIEKTIPDTNAELILYCSGGFRSAIATNNLQKMGYQNVCSLKGGTTAWINAGYPILKNET
jgi:rhodanese-related sulfurtransferase